MLEDIDIPEDSCPQGVLGGGRSVNFFKTRSISLISEFNEYISRIV